MNKKRKNSLIGLLISVFAFIISFNSIAFFGKLDIVAYIATPILLISIPSSLIFTILFIVFSIVKKCSTKNKVTDEKSKKDTIVSTTEIKDQERTFKNSVKRTPWYIWLIFIIFSLFGLAFLIIPPLSIFGVIIIAFFWFACFWLPYYTWKNEHIRAPWPSGKLTDERIIQDVKQRHKFGFSEPFDYRIVEDTVVGKTYSFGDELTWNTITFKKSGKYEIKSSMFQKYYSPIEIAMHIQEGEGVYLIFSNRTNELEFVYRKIYCTL